MACPKNLSSTALDATMPNSNDSSSVESHLTASVSDTSANSGPQTPSNAFATDKPTRAVQPFEPAPANKHTTFPLPILQHPNLTTLRITDNARNRFNLFHIGQVAAYIAAENSIRSRHFNPRLLPFGFEEFTAIFNAAVAKTGSPKHFAVYDYTTSTACIKGEKITLEDFSIDPALIGWRRVLSPKRQRLLEQLLWQNVEAGSNRNKKRKFSSHVPTESPSHFQHDDDDDDSSNGAAAMVY
ncbi:unnamed protein product [Cyclocybe aegerita]|uniref:Uncharacterized protein n=1 Tax=Cyclocybe aegerita TaxID=1973307 RepID=A0A8S0X8Q1_CYCAE|nr:unnamed protein product [Cyclocybe aegerita]